MGNFCGSACCTRANDKLGANTSWSYVGGRDGFQQLPTHDRGAANVAHPRTEILAGAPQCRFCSIASAVLLCLVIVALAVELIAPPIPLGGWSLISATNSIGSHGTRALATTRATTSPSITTSRGATVPEKSAEITTSSSPYDCEAAYFTWAQTWSTEKKLWCCAHFQRGCITTLGTTAVTTSRAIAVHESILV